LPFDNYCQFFLFRSRRARHESDDSGKVGGCQFSGSGGVPGPRGRIRARALRGTHTSTNPQRGHGRWRPPTIRGSTRCPTTGWSAGALGMSPKKRKRKDKKEKKKKKGKKVKEALREVPPFRRLEDEPGVREVQEVWAEMFHL